MPAELRRLIAFSSNLVAGVRVRYTYLWGTPPAQPQANALETSVLCGILREDLVIRSIICLSSWDSRQGGI